METYQYAPTPEAGGEDTHDDSKGTDGSEEDDDAEAVIRADHTSVGRPQEEGMMSVAASFPSEKKPRLSNQ